jgi:hypothetical protein
MGSHHALTLPGPGYVLDRSSLYGIIGFSVSGIHASLKHADCVSVDMGCVGPKIRGKQLENVGHDVAPSPSVNASRLTNEDWKASTPEAGMSYFTLELF